MPQKVELVKPEGPDPSMLYMIDYPVDLVIVLLTCFEYTTTVYSFDGLPYQKYNIDIVNGEVASYDETGIENQYDISS